MLVSGQGEEGITPIHEVTAEQGVRVHNGGLSADNRTSMQMNHKEDLLMFLHGGIQLLGQVIGHVGHAGLLLVGTANAAFVFVGLLIVLFLGILAVTLTALRGFTSCSTFFFFSSLLLLVLAP